MSLSITIQYTLKKFFKETIEQLLEQKRHKLKSNPHSQLYIFEFSDVEVHLELLNLTPEKCKVLDEFEGLYV